MYGPPPEPSQVLAAPAPWFGWVLCLLAGAALASTRRPFLVVVGIALALTAPAAWEIPGHVWGAFPTIDKAGSLAFYLSGVQWRFLDADDPGMRLIGIHVGHLWVTAALDLVLAPFAAMAAQSFLNLCLSWWAAAKLFEATGARRDVSLLCAAPFGLGLHQFRDINWYTVEKTALYWLPLYMWAVQRRSRWAPLVLAGAFLVNIYIGLIAALAGALLVLDEPRRWRIVGLSALAVLPLGFLQWRLMQGGDPEAFLTERAALDVLTWSHWNRLELWRAVNGALVLVSVAGFALGVARRWWVAVGVATVLALGPTNNPVYRLLFEVVPGFWRVAKPETFFHLAYLVILAAAAQTLTRFSPSRTTVGALALALAAGWLLSVRTHPVYPGFTVPREVKLGKEYLP